ncbi:hypothetical protein G7046_g8237 [Stylonectria norvegica]|nr:hypothetical protein G7046_g8237 [Stylonectria norvegica]
MDRPAGLATPSGQNLKPARRKLQKCDPKLKGRTAKRGSADSSASNSVEPVVMSPTTRNMGAFPHSPRPTPPDLSDSKWKLYVENRPWTSPAPQPEPKVSGESQHRLIPEFSHLNIQDPAARPSLDSSSMPSPASSTSTVSARRRQAKTPVFRIGQLESPILGQDVEPLAKTSNVELIAEQYQALLESNVTTDDEATHVESRSRPHHAPELLEVLQSSLRRKSPVTARPDTLPPSPQATNPPAQLPPQLPSQDSGELVAFEEDAIYFKPISFDPEPSPPLRHQSFDPETPSPSSHDSLSLQICLDLLTRELSSAVANRPQRGGHGTAALQIWVMIEAYERLREQVSKMSLHNRELESVGLMFKSWLSALYSIHTSLTGGALPSESEYDGLEEDLD